MKEEELREPKKIPNLSLEVGLYTPAEVVPTYYQRDVCVPYWVPHL